jgi:hypothetical protein
MGFGLTPAQSTENRRRACDMGHSKIRAWPVKVASDRPGSVSGHAGRLPGLARLPCRGAGVEMSAAIEPRRGAEFRASGRRMPGQNSTVTSATVTPGSAYASRQLKTPRLDRAATLSRVITIDITRRQLMLQ